MIVKIPVIETKMILGIRLRLRLARGEFIALGTMQPFQTQGAEP